MKARENDFFRGSTLRICGSLEIEKALWQSLMYIRDFMPAEQMGFHVYHPDLGVVETVARATPDSAEAMSVKTPLSPRALRQIEAQRSIRVRVIDRLRDDPVTRPVAEKFDAQELSAVVMDLVLEKKMLGVFSVFNNGREKFTEDHVRLLSLLNGPCAVALTNFLRYREVMTLRDELADDNRYLRDELRRMSGEDVVGADFGLKEVMDLVCNVAPLDSPVLLLGETGTGKEVIANAIHKSSARRDRPFIAVNCGAIPQSLLDSELFGYEKGAFTGAMSRRRGRIERANGGTLFLDEIGELTAEAQVRLLRVLQEKEIDRIGGTLPVPVDIRVVAATHRNLEEMMAAGTFRQDLYFRLRVFPVAIPPLRERKEDIPALVQHFILKKSREMKRPTVPVPAKDAIDRLMAYRWPGNVRELENAVERSLILNHGNLLHFKEIGNRMMGHPSECPAPMDFAPDGALALDRVMARHIAQVLRRCGGRVEGERGAARLLEIKPSTLRKRMEKLGIPFGRKAKATGRVFR